MTFNLVDCPFLPAITEEGALVELSLTHIFERSPMLKEIRDPSPLVTAALHRFLLAVIHSSIRGPSSFNAWTRLWNGGGLPLSEIHSYLEAHRDRFDLCDPKNPFFQDRTLKTTSANPISRLAKEMATGNNATLFDHSCETTIEALPASAIARLLIAEQAFAVGGGKSETGYTTNGPLVGGIVLMAIGENLFQTLLLNLQIYHGNKPIPSFEGDQSVWEAEASPRSKVPGGYLEAVSKPR